MQGYKLTPQQAAQLQNQWYAPGCFFAPVQDANGDYFIFSGEVNNCVNQEFLWVKNLVETHYETPVITEE